MQTLTFLFAFIAVLALIGVAAWLVRRFATNRLGANTNRGRMPRLAVIDAAAVDGRRRLVLVRRDNVEHLLMIGGPSDIVVEPNIVRAMPGRDQMAPRPAVAGEAPPRIAPLPDANWNDDAARADAFDHHAEPQMPEPPPRPARPSFADEVRRPAPPPMPERRSDPLGRLRARADGQPSRTAARAGAAAPDPHRTADAAPAARQRAAQGSRKAPPDPRARARRRTAASASAGPCARAVERRPESRRDGAAARSRVAPAGRTVAPPVAPEPPPVRAARAEAPAPAPQKSGFENLEDEMASLLGRPKSPS